MTRTAIHPSEAARTIRSRRPDFTPLAGIVLGSGLAPIADQIEDPLVVPYGVLPGFPLTAVGGHPGRLILGWLGGVPVACLQGRTHAYEGQETGGMRTPVRSLHLLGCEVLYLTCASGGIRADLEAGSLMAITDHLNLMGSNPLAGANDPSFGPRFPDMTCAYDRDLVALQQAAAADLGVVLADGVYAAMAGPSYETPAEIRMLERLGADAVGMSVVPECIIARHCGMRVAATAAIANPAAAAGGPILDHDDVVATVETTAKTLGLLIGDMLSRWSASAEGQRGA